MNAQNGAGRRLRVGLVGAGNQMLDCLSPAIRSIDDAYVSGVCDLHLEKASFLAAQHAGAEAFSSIEKMVHVATPDLLVAACAPQAHEEVIAEALSSGLPVFVEKPPTATLEALRHLSDSAARKGLVTGVGMNFRFSTAYLTLKQMLLSGEYGRPVLVSVTHVANKPRQPLWERDLLWSVLLAQAVHPVDLVVDLIGSAEITDSVRHYRGDRLAIGIHLKSAGCAFGSIIVATGAQRFHFRIEVATDSGAVLSSSDLMDVLVRPADAGETGSRVAWNASPLDRGHRRAGYAGELSAFCEAVRSGRPFTPALPDLIPTYEVLGEIGGGRQR
ncbi:MAG TPA: Gfo/Idh/MocA family oxidoreductase [Streptosporangiaceae bacterium]|nr:Gfo/Idh/MocA family oxidoreductase [Streptosporangiaceae bacterium]